MIFLAYLWGHLYWSCVTSREQEKTASLSARLSELESANKDLSADMDSAAKRESEHLAFTEKISNKNAQLQSENTTLQAKVGLLLVINVRKLSESQDVH